MSYAGIYGLPGRILTRSMEGQNCEVCEAQAEICVQGETDSFGYEEFYTCKACFDKEKSEVCKDETPYPWNCDWCKKPGVGKYILTRDPEEGMAGPVYSVCRACDDKMMTQAEDEAEEHRREEDALREEAEAEEERLQEQYDEEDAAYQREMDSEAEAEAKTK